MKQFTVFLLAGFFLFGCGKDISEILAPESAVLGGNAYEIIGNATLSITDKSIAGSGKVAVAIPRATNNNHYSLKFKLDPGGSLTLVTNARSNLEGGLAIRFYRQGNGLLGGHLKTSVEDYDFTGDLSGDALSSVNPEVEVHGDHGHFSIDGVADSELEYTVTMPNSGRYWGLILNQAEVTKAVAGEANLDEGEE